MQTVTRWKIACLAFAAVAAMLAVRMRSASRDVAAVPVSGASPIPLALRRPIRVAPAALGISERELIERIVAAKSLRDIRLLCEKLGVVGSDDAVDALVGLLADSRPGVPQAILGAFVVIGTERAIDVVIETTRDDREMVRRAAIESLGYSQSAKAEQLLINLSAKAGDPAQETAIAALGSLGSDGAVAKLIDLASASDYSTATIAVTALGDASTPTAAAALRKLVDAPDRRIAAAALAAIDTIDDELLGKVTALIRSGDAQLAEVALTALAHNGVDSLPMLREVTLHGATRTRIAAVNAIGEVGGAHAVAALGELLQGDDPRVAEAAAAQLAYRGGQEARELLINAALSDRAKSTNAIAYLAKLSGDDVDQALMSAIKHGASQDRRAALPRLLKAGHTEALEMTIDWATKGSANDRNEAIRLLAESRSPRAIEALVKVATTSHGNARVFALESLVQVQPNDATVGRLLSETLRSGRSDEVSYAAELLGRTGTDAARQALVSALGHKNKATAVAAANALGQSGLTDDVKSALLSAATASDQMKAEVMSQLLQAGASEGTQLARELLTGNDPQAAARAIFALASRGTAADTQLVQSALTSKQPSVRASALSALGQDADDRFTDTLVRFAHDDDQLVRATALSKLGELGTDAAQHALLNAARHGATDDRVAAIQSLRSVDNARVGSELVALMRDPDPSVATAAIWGAELGGPEVDSQLVGLVNDSNAAEVLKNAAAIQLRNRGTALDPSTEAVVAQLAGESGDSSDGGHGD